MASVLPSEDSPWFPKESNIKPVRVMEPSDVPGHSRQDTRASDYSSTTGASSSTSGTGTLPVDPYTERITKIKESLAVNQQSKVAEHLSKKNPEETNKSSVLVSFSKWFVTLLLFCLSVACLTGSKFGIISLSQKLNTTLTTGNDKDHESAVYLMMLCVLLIVPSFITFIRSIWEGAFRKDLPWPSNLALIVGLICAALETFGLCLFVFSIFTSVPPVIGVVLMNGVFFLPIIWNLLRCIRFGVSRIKLWFILFIVSLIFEISGIGITIATPFISTIQGLYTENAVDSWHLIVAVLCLSIAWLPALQKLQLNPRKEKEKPIDLPPRQAANRVLSNTATSSSGYNSIESAPNIEQQNQPQPTAIREDNEIYPMKTEDHNEELRSARWKNSIFSSFFRMLLVPLFAYLLVGTNIANEGDSAIDVFVDGWKWSSNPNLYAFILNLTTSFIGQIVSFLACSMSMQGGAYAAPLILATPLATILTTVPSTCTLFLAPDQDDKSSICNVLAGDTTTLVLIIVAVICLFLGQLLSSGVLAFQSRGPILQKEFQIFWLPGYNGVLLEQWLLLSRRTAKTGEKVEDPRERARKSKVFICTTMYRETDYEMTQLLRSINRINSAQMEGDRHFESHVFFDGGVKDSRPSVFVMQLISLLEDTLHIKPEDCTKVMTPYGMTLSWNLPAPMHKRNMMFRVHLKDNLKVKNKKRWSQVMYMSYVLDFLLKSSEHANEGESYILTTDADVTFTPESAEALLDLMTRDSTVGAVCARTHPLGNGPIVWYQVFEYAIGHWFQKVAEHVLGSVLCAPGCFSVYRCKALRDVLPIYSTNVNEAFDFLTKDMGEDRWLCTLMVQSGWRIEYCAAAENSTHCPEEFDEFYKQRRRWIASTIANLMVLIKEWKLVSTFNHRVSIWFILYQAALLFSTLIGPSTVILVISGGLYYAWGIDAIAVTIIQIVVSFGFGLICLMTSQNTQLKAAKVMTFVYAVIMTATVVGTAEQVVEDLSAAPASTSNGTITTAIPTAEFTLFTSISTLYLGGLVAIFLITGILHLPELYCLLHGIWYLLCLPAGYLLLNIYSISNITDRSWGTREEKNTTSSVASVPWHQTFQNTFLKIFFCCAKKDPPVAVQNETRSVQTERRLLSDGQLSFERNKSRLQSYPSAGAALDQDALDRNMADVDIVDADTFESVPFGYMSISEDVDDDVWNVEIPIPVEEWLPAELKDQYAPMFKRNGFDDTRFITGLTEKELRNIGVKIKGHIQHLLEHIKVLPDFDIETEVPKNSYLWLEKIGLTEYKERFIQNRIIQQKDMEVLKTMNRRDIEKDLRITKPGHVKRLLQAIRRLRNPTPVETKILEMRRFIDNSTTHQLKEINAAECEFWEALKSACLTPLSTVFGLEEELKVKLGDLRNSWLLIVAVTNTLWLIVISTLANKANLSILDANPLGLVFLFVFGAILVIQFLCMLLHRLLTLIHLLGRAPYRCGQAYHTFWAFRDDDTMFRDINDEKDFEAIIQVKQDEKIARKRNRQAFKPKSIRHRKPEASPLIGEEEVY